MKFQKGQSGNPKGRPRGLSPSYERLAQALKQGPPEKIIHKLEEMAYEKDDATAAKFLAERLYPVHKVTMPPIKIPGLGAPTLSMTQKAECLLSAAGEGQVPLDMAATMIAALANVAKLAEMDELKARVEVLERQAKERDAIDVLS